MTVPRRLAGLAALFAILAAALAGCGTTVSVGRQATATGNAGEGLAAPTALAGNGAPTASGAAPVEAAGHAGGSLSGAAAAGASVATSGGASSLPAGTAASGAIGDHAAITVGFQVAQNLQAGYAAVGAGGPAPDEGQAAQAVVDWVNKHGGLAGHQVHAVIHETNPTSGSFASQAQSACSDFTEDHHVAAVITSPSTGGSDLIADCLAQHHTVDIEENHWVYDAQDYRRLAPYLYRPSDMRPERWGPAYVDGLATMGFFPSGARVGLVRFDSGVFTHIANDVVKPRLAAHHVTLAAEAIIGEPGGVSDFGSMAAAIQSAILRFRSLGVDHVMFLENAAELPFFWLPAAQNEQYFPQYGFTSVDQPWLQAANHPQALAHGAVGVGWLPPSDVFDENHPGGNPAWSLCNAIMRNAGVQNVTNNTWSTGAFCDGVFFLRALFAHTDATSPSALRSAVNGLGHSFDSPMTFGATLFAAGRYDGASEVARLAFRASCQCFRYVSAPYPVP